jgi:Uncharacterized protein involved in tolerance to divalent cations
MAADPEYLMILNTCPDADTAGHIARQLVEREIAACVNIVPGVKSWFRWQNKIECAEECLLLIKTRNDCYNAVVDQIRSNHPYELPEIIAVSVIQGLEDYLRWIDQATNRIP